MSHGMCEPCMERILEEEETRENPGRQPWGRVTRIEYVHHEDGNHYFHDFERPPALYAVGRKGTRALIEGRGLWRDL